MNKYTKRIIANEISFLSKYFDNFVDATNSDSRDTELLSEIESKHIIDLEKLTQINNYSSLIFLYDSIHYVDDIQKLLTDLKSKCNRSSRLAVLAYNPYYRWFYKLAVKLGVRRNIETRNFVTLSNITNLAKLSGYEIVKCKTLVSSPFHILGLGTFINKLVPNIPFIKWSCFCALIILRPIIKSENAPKLSVIVPARNEKGNIRKVVNEIPESLLSKIELFFVEGHSTDGTWEEICKTQNEFKNTLDIKAIQQTGKGKCDAVRLGFKQASGELLTILDADLTVPAHNLIRFYEAYINGYGDFINGNRLVYPFEGKAMRFLNLLGNIFFAKALSNVLSIKIGDSLCGSKLLSKSDYTRIESWRNDFGDFDPFGDFELLFGASELGLGVVDLPVKYRDRTYGSTNISRFKHGLQLLKMTLIGFVRVKLKLIK